MGRVGVVLSAVTPTVTDSLNELDLFRRISRVPPQAYDRMRAAGRERWQKELQNVRTESKRREKKSWMFEVRDG